MKQFETPFAGNCLNCGKEMSGSTNPSGGGGPEVGSIAVCIYCGHVMEFGIGLVLQQPSDETILNIAGDPEFLKIMCAVGSFRRRQTKKS